jgi:cob(I)alamin adenosyltransferase
MERTEHEQWTIGELAAVAGVTVRTLRHYDAIELLVPSERSQGGHRRYSHADLSRLYRIVALRGLDFSLADVAAALDDDSAGLPTLVRRQLDTVESDLALRLRLRNRLRRLLDALDESTNPKPTHLLDALEAMMSIRLDQIYTGTGDSGETDLRDGQRVSKTDPALEAGDLEEISAHLAAALTSGALASEPSRWLRRIQNDLVDLGSDIGRPFTRNAEDAGPRVTAGYVEWLEECCDQAKAGLEPLSSFVIPGGPAPVPELHLARTVCRRVERRVLEIPNVNPEVVRYLNRLSDLLFLLARSVARDDELLWQPGAHAPGEPA